MANAAFYFDGLAKYYFALSQKKYTLFLKLIFKIDCEQSNTIKYKLICIFFYFQNDFTYILRANDAPPS